MCSKLLAADTALTTASGATFTSPAGWTVTSSPNKLVLDPPEGDSHLALVDVEAADAAAAVAAAWTGYRPGDDRPLRIATASAPRDGWEELHVYEYETSPNEKAEIYALACRAGQTWTVAIVEASDSTYEKRIAGFALTLGSLRVKSYTREMFTGRKARPLDAERVAQIIDFARDLMQEFGIPGIGLS